MTLRKRASSPIGDLVPIWYSLSDKFHKEVKRIAECSDTPPTAVLELALRMLGQVQMLADETNTPLPSAVQQACIWLQHCRNAGKGRGLTMKEALAGISNPTKPLPSELTIEKSAAVLGSRRWQGVPLEERRKLNRRAVLARWQRKKGPNGE